jgi:exosome complex component RRP40
MPDTIPPLPIQIGTLLYARISHSSSSMEPELECVDPTTGKAEGYGELKGGLLVEASLALCRS